MGDLLIDTLIHPLVVPVVESAKQVPHVDKFELVVPCPGLKGEVSLNLS